MRTFFLNGQEYWSEDTFTLLDLLKYFDYETDIFILEHNKQIRKKQKWYQLEIENQDTIELITIVGGG